MPAEKIREYLNQGGDTREREDEEDRPCYRGRVVEEHHEEREPEACAPRACKERMERAEEGVFRARRKRVANELRDDVVAEKAHEAEDSEPHQDEVKERHGMIEEAACVEQVCTGEDDVREEQGKHDIPECGFHTCSIGYS